MADVLAGVPDGPLDGVTPCPAYSLGDLLDHVATLTFAFTAAATKQTEEIGSQPPTADASRLADDWRTKIPRDLDALTRTPQSRSHSPIALERHSGERPRYLDGGGNASIAESCSRRRSR